VTGAALELDGLLRRFGSVTALDDVSLSVPAGEVHGVIGPNGAGKTTLFDLVTGALRPDEGQVRLDGRDVTGLREDQRARAGVVRSFQLTELFGDLPARENVRLALQARAGTSLNPLRQPDSTLEKRATDWLDRLGIEDSGIEAAALPHGDRKRLEVGTALAADPSVLLLDEPTSGVPDDEAADLVDLVLEERAGRTVLLIEHDVDVALGTADRVTVLDQGVVIAQGSPEQVVTDDRVQDAYLRGYGDAALG
jgi:branched-chain amino acid transport system ATP-binding protein